MLLACLKVAGLPLLFPNYIISLTTNQVCQQSPYYPFPNASLLYVAPSTHISMLPHSWYLHARLKPIYYMLLLPNVISLRWGYHIENINMNGIQYKKDMQKWHLLKSLRSAPINCSRLLPISGSSSGKLFSRMLSAWRARDSASLFLFRLCKAVARNSRGIETWGAVGPKAEVTNFRLRRSKGSHLSNLLSWAYEVARFWRCTTNLALFVPTIFSFACKISSHSSWASLDLEQEFHLKLNWPRPSTKYMQMHTANQILGKNKNCGRNTILKALVMTNFSSGEWLHRRRKNFNN
mgnify:FL=1